jgi:hypothetical protein
VSKPTSALSKFVGAVKGKTKAETSISKFLQHIIEEYTSSGGFDAYLDKHYEDAAKYLRPTHAGPRKGIFRASSAGKCMQAQVFGIVKEPQTDIVSRPPRQTRALWNGTFAHIRWHMLFDALNEKGVVKTLACEEQRYVQAQELSGSIDRLIQFVFNGKTVTACVDYKTIKRQYYDALYGPKEDNAWQQYAYNLMEWGADVWVMIYENKDSHDLKVYDREYDADKIEELKEKYRLGIQWVKSYKKKSKEELPKLPLITEWCNWCEWQKRCLELNPDKEKSA